MPFHTACPFTCKSVCYCAHGPGGAAAPLLDARGAPVSAAAFSRNAAALWALWQAPSEAYDDADGVVVVVPTMPRAPPPELDASGVPVLQAGTAAARRELAAAQKALKSAKAAAERVPKKAAAAAAPLPAAPAAPPPAFLPPPPPPSSLLWDASDALFGPIDDDLLLGSDDLHLPGLPQSMLQPPGARRLLQASEAQPWMAGALVEVFWEAPDSSQPPTGWYTARVQKMSQRGASQLHYEQSNAIETLDAKDLMNLIRRGLIAVLQMPPGGAQQQQLQQLAPVAPLSADNRKRRR